MEQEETIRQFAATWHGARDDRPTLLQQVQTSLQGKIGEYALMVEVRKVGLFNSDHGRRAAWYKAHTLRLRLGILAGDSLLLDLPTGRWGIPTSIAAHWIEGLYEYLDLPADERRGVKTGPLFPTPSVATGRDYGNPFMSSPEGDVRLIVSHQYDAENELRFTCRIGDAAIADWLDGHFFLFYDSSMPARLEFLAKQLPRPYEHYELLTKKRAERQAHFRALLLEEVGRLRHHKATVASVLDHPCTVTLSELEEAQHAIEAARKTAPALLTMAAEFGLVEDPVRRELSALLDV